MAAAGCLPSPQISAYRACQDPSTPRQDIFSPRTCLVWRNLQLRLLALTCSYFAIASPPREARYFGLLCPGSLSSSLSVSLSSSLSVSLSLPTAPLQCRRPGGPLAGRVIAHIAATAGGVHIHMSSRQRRPLVRSCPSLTFPCGRRTHNAPESGPFAFGYSRPRLPDRERASRTSGLEPPPVKTSLV